MKTFLFVFRYWIVIGAIVGMVVGIGYDVRSDKFPFFTILFPFAGAIIVPCIVILCVLCYCGYRLACPSEEEDDGWG